MGQNTECPKSGKGNVVSKGYARTKWTGVGLVLHRQALDVVSLAWRGYLLQFSVLFSPNSLSWSLIFSFYKVTGMNINAFFMGVSENL